MLDLVNEKCYGIRIMPKTLVAKTKHDWAAAWLVYLGDATLEEISEMFQIPYGTVVEYSRTHYWAATRKAAKERGLSVTTQQIKTRMERMRNQHLNHMMDQIEETSTHIADLQIKKPGDQDETKVTVGHKLSLIQQHDNIARKTLQLDDEKTGDPTRDGFQFIMGIAKAARALVNENPGESEEGAVTIEAEAEVTSVDLSIPKNNWNVDQEKQIEGGEKGPENTSSAIDPLPDDSRVNMGILRAFNGHSNGPSNTQNTHQSEESGQNGAIQSLPDKINLSVTRKDQ